MENKKVDRPSEEEMWAGPSGERWLANAVRFEETLRPVGEALIERARLVAGEKVIDVGCGAGSMSLEIAEKVGPPPPGGSVTGLDISPALIGEATRRAGLKRAGGPARFVLGDAARVTVESVGGPADCLVSRFGSMFFTDPYGAFGHMHGLLKKGGRLALACWAPLKENPWMLEVRTVLGSHFEMPVVPPRTPGPFAYDEPAYLADILGKGGFGQIEIEPWKMEMWVGGKGSNPDSATEFLMHALSMAQRALDAPPEVLAKVRVEVSGRLRGYMTAEGVRMPGSVWFATARA